MVQKAKRIICKLRPFKGSYAYEAQIGPIVLQWLHGESLVREGRRVHVWRDSMWWR